MIPARGHDELCRHSAGMPRVRPTADYRVPPGNRWDARIDRMFARFDRRVANLGPSETFDDGLRC